MIFISHSKKDIHFVNQLRNDLIANGLSLWIDEDFIDGGDSLLTKISDGLKKSNILLLLNSQYSINSNWVKNEVEIFFTSSINNEEKKVIVLKLDNSPIPDFLTHLKYIDFTDYNRGLIDLFNSLKITYIKKQNIIDIDNYFDIIIAYIDNSIISSDLYFELEENIRTKRIDQKFLYWNVDSSKKWVDLCLNSEYPLYHRSIELLIRKFEKEILNDIIANSKKLSSFINIGVGSGQKDYIITKALIKKTKSIKYISIDLSFSMIQETLRHLLPLKKIYKNDISIIAIIGDLFKISKYEALLSSTNSRLFGFLGSNISGFSENQILQLFYDNLNNSDLILMEIDWLAGRNDNEILKGYSDEENMKFIWQPLSFLGIPKNLSWKQNFQFEMSSDHTDIPNSKTVKSYYNLNGNKILLSASTKYDKSSFLQHISNKFELINDYSISPEFSLILIKKR